MKVSSTGAFRKIIDEVYILSKQRTFKDLWTRAQQWLKSEKSTFWLGFNWLTVPLRFGLLLPTRLDKRRLLIALFIE
jgi:hypothetical protein